MGKWSRRQILLAGFVAGAGISITTSHFRRQQNDDETDDNAEGANLAYQAEASGSKIREIQQSVNLRQPTVPYDRQMSKLLVRCCRLATEQYLQGVAEPNYDGAIASLESYFPELDKYQQINSFKGLRERSWLEPIIQRIGLGDLIPKSDLIYGGFTLKSSANNIIVIRGTQELEEWIANLNAKQIYYQTNNPEAGKVHQGFYNLYFNGSDKIGTQIEQLDPTIPCYITGHSLGGAMAVLAAIDLALNYSNLKEQIRMYNYAPPRVGDPTFAKFYSELVPNSYRVVNQADSTWLLPPTQLNNATYLHVGQTWSFINQTGDLSPNHQLGAYKAAIDREVEKYQPFTLDPVSGF